MFKRKNNRRSMLVLALVVVIGTLGMSLTSFAGGVLVKHPDDMMMFTPHVYVGANIGVSSVYDLSSVAGSHVDQTGPGWSVVAGYQITPIFAAEAGFTKYHNSEDDLAGVNLAETEHYAVDLVGTAKVALSGPFGVLGKFGLAYNYARKTFTATGVFGQADTINVYGGVGAFYAITHKVDIVLQWMRSRGNRRTGSTDLYSIGVTMALI